MTTRAELIAALNNGVASPTSPSNPSNEPKIIYVEGTIDFNVDDANQPLVCEDYYRNGFTIEAFPSDVRSGRVGPRAPSGPLEAARIASQERAASARADPPRLQYHDRGSRQERTSQRRVARHPRHRERCESRTNIIIRNLTFQDTFDCFPQWAPTDGALGSWNAQYDSHLVARHGPRLGRPQHLRRSRHRRRALPQLLWRALSGARRVARHHQRIRSGHRLVEPLSQSRQGDAHRLVGQRARGSRASCG